jgi:hypothetical protein
LAFAALSASPDACCARARHQASVLAFWVGYAAAELKPLYLRLRELILASGKIAVDETKAPVLDPGRGRIKQGFFWAVARDDRPWGGADPQAIAFTYAPGRGAVHALKLLDSYRGVVRCDGYATYKTIAAKASGEAITRLLLGASAPPILRARQSWERADRQRSARTHRRGDREDDPRRKRRGVPQGASGQKQAADRGAKDLLRATARPRFGQGVDRRGDALWLEPLGRAHAFPRRRPQELDTIIVERGIRPIATGLSLCTSCSSVWKHWKWLCGIGATRATFTGDRRADGLRLQIA